jgi:CRP-like cAMP-binding protein
MNLTWHIGGRTPPASSWGSMAGRMRMRTSSTPGRKPVIGAAVVEAMRDGLKRPTEIAERTGYTRDQVVANLRSMRAYGFVRSTGEGRDVMWSLA